MRALSPIAAPSGVCCERVVISRSEAWTLSETADFSSAVK